MIIDPCIFQFSIWCWKEFTVIDKYDMIKVKECDVANIDFELQAKRGAEFLFFTLFWNFTELLISHQPDVRLW